MRQNVSANILFILITLSITFFHVHGYGQSSNDNVLRIIKSEDFSIDGTGQADNWSKTNWINIIQIDSNETKRDGLSTKAKVLYSDTGIYFLFQNEDQILNATLDSDFSRLWTEDVVEVFLWPDEQEITYFEYELSPLNYELILRITRDEKGSSSWQPFSYRGDKLTRHYTSISGGEKRSGESITGWTAEFFLPYTLMHPANNMPPDRGTKWRANLYRIDYDAGQTLMAWQPVNTSFHEYDNYGVFLFE